MKPKRVVLVFDYDDSDAAVLRCMLRAHGYNVLSCSGGPECIAIMQRNPVDLLLVGEHMSTAGCDCAAGGMAVLRLTAKYRCSGGTAQLVQDMRIALMRKPGPKKAVSSLRFPVSREAVGA